MLMRALAISLSMAAAALGQNAPVMTVAAGVPLRVALERRTRVRRTGEPLRARLVEPVYVYDRLVIPAGSLVEGHISGIAGVPALRRINAILSGNFTPERDARAQFDGIVLSDGSKIPVQTTPSRGTSYTARVGRHGNAAGATANSAAMRAFTTPGPMSQLKMKLIGMLPVHRQAWRAGTLFTSTLENSIPAPAGAATGAIAETDDGEVRARLVTALDSRTARRGAPVEALVMRPVFAKDHTLLIPEGARLTGDVVEATPARGLHRNGRLLFAFRRVTLPGAQPRSIHGYLDGVEADFEQHLAIDSEGAARATSPKTRFIFPAVAIAAASLSFHQDYNAQGVPDQDIGGRAESGAVGLGLIGTVVAQVSRTVASSIAIAGAGYSVYTTFLARGNDVVLPVNTPLKVSLARR